MRQDEDDSATETDVTEATRNGEVGRWLCAVCDATFESTDPPPAYCPACGRTVRNARRLVCELIMNIGPVEKKTILVVSRNAELAGIRKRTLESAGYRVIAAADFRVVAETCQKETIDLIMLGYLLPPSERRRVWVEARKHCKAPVLELYESGKAELLEESNTHVYEAHTSEDFLEAAKFIFTRKDS